MQRKPWLVGLVVVASGLVAREASARTLYVSGGGSDAQDGSAPGRALRSLQAAAQKTAPGDVVEVDDGVYDAFTIKISGTDTAWIRYVAKSGAKPKIQFTGWNAISIESAHHIEIRGFEVAGPMASRTLAQCTADADAATPDPLCNGNGISIDSRKVDAKAHHILIAGNDVHDCPGAGISAIQADYVTVEGNFVHGNALHTRYGASGISYLTSWNSDDTTGVKMIVRQNRVFGNKTLVKWAQIGKLSDGNGIIIDTSRNDAAGSTIAAYKGRFLVENNVSAGNGGSGVHAFDSEHVDIIHNTTFENGQVVGYAEIFANNSTDVRIINNVMIGRADGGVNTKDPKSTATYDYNVYFAGNVASMGPNDVVADPKVRAASLDPLVADFRLAAGSPAIDTGTATLTSPVDITGAKRPAGAAPDRGAYEEGAVVAPVDAGTGAADAGAAGDSGETVGSPDAASGGSAGGGGPGARTADGGASGTSGGHGETAGDGGAAGCSAATAASGPSAAFGFGLALAAFIAARRRRASL